MFGWAGGPLMMMEDFLSADFKCFNQELNCFSRCGTVDYFKTLWDLIFSKSFFTPTTLKLMIYLYQGAPTDYFITMFLLSSNEG